MSELRHEASCAIYDPIGECDCGRDHYERGRQAGRREELTALRNACHTVAVIVGGDHGERNEVQNRSLIYREDIEQRIRALSSGGKGGKSG